MRGRRRTVVAVACAMLLLSLPLAADPPAVTATANGVDPAAYDFGAVATWGSDSTTVTTTMAEGWHLLQAAGTGLSAPFGFGWGTCTGDPGPATCAWEESFAPTTVGPASAQVTLTFCTGACLQAEWEAITVTFTGTGADTDAAPSVVSTLPANGATHVSPDTTLSVTFSEPVLMTGSSFGFGCSPSGQHAFTLGGGPVTYTLDPEPALAEGDTCSLTILGDAIHDLDKVDPPDTVAGDVEIDFRVSADQVGPVDTAPAVALRSGVQLAGTGIGAVVRWSGSDNPGGSGLVRHELERSTDGGTTWTTVSAALVTSANVTLPSSGTVRFRVRGVDRAGNPGAWAYGPRLAPRLVQQTSSTFQYAGTWTRATGVKYSGGSVRYAKRSGASAAYRVSGRAVALVMTQAPDRGRFRVYVDGVRVAWPDTYHATVRYRDQVWAATWSSSGTHTVRIVVSGTSGRPHVDLDAIAVLLPAP